MATAGGPVRTADDLFDALQAAGGGTVELSIVRGADERAIQVVLGDDGEQPAEA